MNNVFECCFRFCISLSYLKWILFNCNQQLMLFLIKKIQLFENLFCCSLIGSHFLQLVFYLYVFTNDSRSCSYACVWSQTCSLFLICCPFICRLICFHDLLILDWTSLRPAPNPQQPKQMINTIKIRNETQTNSIWKPNKRY
jgi:hypothetical protein